MNRERLELSIATMRDVIATKKRFDITDWIFDGRCGTAACVGGWCALDPAHNANGLVRSPGGYLPAFEGRFAEQAMKAYWGISEKACGHIIYLDSYGKELVEAGRATVTPEMAIKHIQDVLDGKVE